MIEKIKTAHKNITRNLRQVISSYPFTWSLVIITSLMLAIFIDQSGTIGEFMEDSAIPFLLLWEAGVWFSETQWQDRRFRWLGIIATALIAFLLIYFSGNGSPAVEETVSRLRKAYALVTGLLGIWQNYRRSGSRFDRYCARLGHELSRLMIVCGIVAMGVAFVTAVFITLILNQTHYTLMIRAEFLVIGCLAGTGFLDILIKPERELPQFFVRIVRDILMSLLLAAFLIVYGYILKIIITRVVPSNEIFRILAGLFIIGLPIWTIAGSFPEDRPLVKIGMKLPYVFIPFLFLQGYAIHARISAYGLTPARCFCLALMLFEVIYIAVYALRRRDASVMLPVAAGLTVLCLAVPGINVYSLSNRSQKAIFDRSISEDYLSLSPEDQSSLAGAFYYLNSTAQGKAMLSEVPPEKTDAIIKSGKVGMPEYDENTFIYQEFAVQHEDIEDYSSMTLVSTTYPGFEWRSSYDPEAISFYTPDGTPAFTADISLFISTYLSSGAESEDFPYLIDSGDGNVFRLTYCSLTLLPDKTVQYPELRGILFERKK